MRTWTHYFPNATMATDWDVLQAIKTAKRHFQDNGSDCKLCYVKGHQDKTTSYTDLSLDAQLNVETDKLAGEYEYKPDQTATAPIITGSTVILQSRHGSTTSKYRSVIRRMITNPIIVHQRQTWVDRRIRPC